MQQSDARVQQQTSHVDFASGDAECQTGDSCCGLEMWTFVCQFCIVPRYPGSRCIMRCIASKGASGPVCPRDEFGVRCEYLAPGRLLFHRRVLPAERALELRPLHQLGIMGRTALARGVHRFIIMCRLGGGRAVRCGGPCKKF